MRIENQNPLYPVFFKLHNLKMLVVGAGEVGHEKLHFILKSSPDANITLVAPWTGDEMTDLLAQNKYKITWIQRKFKPTDIADHDLIVAATNFREVNLQVHQAAKENKRLINVADTPDLCDFYLGSIVTRGSLKVAISTNGKSPTFAKRFRQYLESILPNTTDEVIHKLKLLRDDMKGDFDAKVEQLNKLTETLVHQKN